MAPEEEQYPELPKSLIEGLKALDRSAPMITARVDRRVSEMAAVHFSARREPTRMPHPLWSAVAATLLIAALIGYWRLDPAPERERADVYADIDGSGQIDIADVLALARSRDAGERSREQLDRFAARIVSLKTQGETS